MKSSLSITKSPVWLCDPWEMPPSLASSDMTDRGNTDIEIGCHASERLSNR
jgi:hypothetical protein